MNAVAMPKPMREEEMRLPPELEAKLREPLPPQAITPHPSKTYLSSIKPAFIIERMNEVFGIGSYKETYREISVTTKEQHRQNGKVTLFVGTVHGTLEIPRFGIHLENFGGSENDDAGDALKGAATDAFTKMCSHLGIGLDVYKGKHDGQAENQLPPCPNCGKQLRKSKNDEGYYCWEKKGGCGSNFSEDGLKAAQNAKASPAAGKKPVASSNGSDPGKITIIGIASNIRTEGDLFRTRIGVRECATRDQQLIKSLARVDGKEVELLVTPIEGRTGTIHQIHKVVKVNWGGAQ